MILCPDTTTSDSQAVSGVNAVMTPSMAADEIWIFVSTTNCWIAQHASAPVAAAADANMFIPANVIMPISGRAGAKLAVIQASAGGTASLTRALRF